MSNSAIGEEERQLLTVPYRIHPASKLFIVLLAAVVMLPSLSIDSCLASLGSARMIAGAISAELVALWYNGTPVAMTGAMLLYAAAALGFWLFSLRFFPEALEAVPRRRAENVFAEH